MRTLLVLVLSLLSTQILARNEADWVNAICTGQIEYRLSDKTRVDCLTDTHAIEYDFQHKWAEAIGQSLHYSLMTGKKAGITLICKNAMCPRGTIDTLQKLTISIFSSTVGLSKF